jgi:hypothetical protein
MLLTQYYHFRMSEADRRIKEIMDRVISRTSAVLGGEILWIYNMFFSTFCRVNRKSQLSVGYLLVVIKWDADRVDNFEVNCSVGQFPCFSGPSHLTWELQVMSQKLKEQFTCCLEDKFNLGSCDDF